MLWSIMIDAACYDIVIEEPPISLNYCKSVSVFFQQRMLIRRDMVNVELIIYFKQG